MLLFGGLTNAQNWLTTGNSPSGGSVLGTNDNNPLNIRTNTTQRMHINPNGTTAGTPTVQTDGYVGIGLFPTDIRSRLTITGSNNTSFGGGGFRDWMKTGVFSLENSDNMYVGMMEEDTNRSDAIVAFGDDDADAPFNNFRILFAGNGATNSGHLELARYTATGNIGFGPVFTNAAQPQSLLHLNRDGNNQTWFQITSQTGTGQTQNDGLRLGIGSGGVAFLRQQENRPIRIQTDWNGTPGGINNGERMRITSIGETGVPAPAGAPNDNITRVAISHNGASPITQPRSLLHLGYDVGQPLPSNDGWRDWMDVGTFINQGTDNIYVGLKNEGGSLTDQYDAVINWGDNQDSLGSLGVGPDNLRFIFTSTADGGGDSISTSNNGLEVARMEPLLASTLDSNLHAFGMMGIGNFAPGSPNDVNSTPVDAKLDIDGDLRIREVTRDSTLKMVLVIDTSDLGRVHYLSIDDFGGGGIGNYCTEPDDTLAGHYEVPLNDYNYYFTGSQPYPDITNNTNGVAIGLDCADPLWGKLHVLQDEGNLLLGGNLWSFSGYFDNTGDDAFVGVAVAGIAQGEKEIQNFGGLFRASNGADFNIGVQGDGTSNTVGSTTRNMGGFFNASGGDENYGIWAQAPVNATSWAAWFNGNTFSTGTYQGSDESLKENIAPLANATDVITELNPVTYDYLTNEFPQMNLSQGNQMGLIAQELEQVLPGLVKATAHPAVYDSSGNETFAEMEFKAVNYTQLIPLLIAGFQEQQAELAQRDDLINSLEERLNILEDCIAASRLCETGDATNKMNDGASNGETVTLENRNAIVLDQNLPNPFAEQTTITYLIPEEVSEAELIFYDIRGRIVNQVQINERGNSKMTVYGENLKNGVYTYSLIADGQLISTKKMVKQ